MADLLIAIEGTLLLPSNFEIFSQFLSSFFHNFAPEQIYANNSATKKLRDATLNIKDPVLRSSLLKNLVKLETLNSNFPTNILT